MLSNSAFASAATVGAEPASAPATTFRPAASQPLSTDDRIGLSGSPVGGHAVSFAPVRRSYQLKYWPLGAWRSIRSSVASVCVMRATASACPMVPSRSTTTVLHRYAPMFVVEVWTLGVPSAWRLSAGRPLSGSVIATSDAQVSAAYPRSVERSA